MVRRALGQGEKQALEATGTSPAEVMPPNVALESYDPQIDL
jgi:hypothetical protein